VVTPTRFAIAVMLGVIGLLILAAGAAGILPEPRKKAPTDDEDVIESLAVRMVAALLGTAAAFITTGWPVMMGFGALAGWFLPTFATAKRRRRESVERIEAIAVWTESLRDTMAASAGLQEALRTSARVAPNPIRTEVRDLALRLQHQTTTAALRQFAADMAHPLADLVVASLVLAASRHGGSLQSVLLMTAKAARDSAAMMRHVEAGRARIYSQARMAGWVSFGMIGFLILTQRDFLAPFGTLAGQIMLLVIGGAFFGSGVAVYRLSRSVEPRRVFADIEAWGELGIEEVAS
jgi:Flp pilus assembly protein TadB